MVLMRNNVQKESTYGWYPPSVDIYQNPRANHGYDKECLYNFWKSNLLYPNAADDFKSITPPAFQGSRASSRSRAKSMTRASSKSSVIQAPKQMLDLTIKGSRPQSLTLHSEPRTPVFHPRSQTDYRIPTPNVSRGHHGWRPQPTIIGVIDPEAPYITKSPVLNADEATVEAALMYTSKPQDGSYRTPTPAERLASSNRVQSASLNRPRITPQRPVKSAVVRSGSKATNATSSISINLSGKNMELGAKKPSRTYWVQLKDEIANGEDQAAVNCVDVVTRPPTPVNLRTPTPEPSPYLPTYEDQVDKYGWLAEVHGDPLNLKVITERLPYTVKCDEPVVAEDPYKTKVVMGETFFYNTIPVHKMTFTVHPEWQSEHFVEQRKQLEKQGKTFHTRNYGFVY